MNLKAINNKLASLPTPKKILLLISFIIFFGVIWNFFILKPLNEKTAILQQELAQQQQTLQENLKASKDIDSFKQEVELVRQELLMAQAQLPTKKEIPNLLTKISDLGNQCGFEFELFKPQKEEKKDFYSQLPISMKVRGTYGNVSNFFHLVSALDRIVNIGDFTIKNPKVLDNYILLETTCQAITYRFQPNTSKKKGKKSGNAKKK